jgi:putative endonuclease
MSQSYDLGKQGEELACQTLVQAGCRILDTRWKLHHLELDIVATDGQSLIFAEVKTRRTPQWGDPLDAITPQKMRFLTLAADAYIKTHRLYLPYRFDLFNIFIDGNGHSSVEHIKDAFYPPLG